MRRGQVAHIGGSSTTDSDAEAADLVQHGNFVAAHYAKALGDRVLRLLLEYREGTQIPLAGRPEHTVALAGALARPKPKPGSRNGKGASLGSRRPFRLTPGAGGGKSDSQLS